jgi:cytochrome d ubiquinol oxidase subunit I
MRTSDAVSPNITAAAVASSLATYAVAYAVIFGAGIWYLLGLVRKGPQPQEEAPDTEGGDKTPARPLSVGDPDDAGMEGA